tara:strand:+ start:32 stop:415 length:384 start_codon:yes stop_codon:yes gene_type:complete
MAYEENEEEKEARFVRERARRELRKKQRKIRKEEKAELGKASGTRDRRSIKEDADAALEKAEFKFNEKYKPSENKQDYESDIQQRGIDQFTAPDATPGSGSSNAFTLDVVKDDNTAGTATFNGPGIN